MATPYAEPLLTFTRMNYPHLFIDQQWERFKKKMLINLYFLQNFGRYFTSMPYVELSYDSDKT